MAIQIPQVPNLTVQQPQQVDALGQYAKMAQLKDMLGQQQLLPLQVQEQQQRVKTATLQNQMTEEDLANREAMGKVLTAANGDVNKATEMVSDPQQNFGLSPRGIGQAIQTIGQYREGIYKLQDEAAKNLDMKNGVVLPLLQKLNDADPADRPAVRDALLGTMKSSGLFAPQEMNAAANMGLDDKTVGLNLAAHRSQQQLIAERETKVKELDAANGAWKPLNGQLVNTRTGDKMGANLDVDSLNKALETRYQVLHPGDPLPTQFTLKPGASPEDFGRVDKVMEATEKATGTKSQQEQTNAIRAQTFELQKDKTGLDAVVGADPKTGRTVLVPLSQAQQMGIQNPMKADADMVYKAQASRHWLQLANGQTDPKGAAEDMGILQLVNKLDSEGKLGPLAGRWNDFMSGKWGAGDTDYAALRAKMGLSTTLLMQAHVGSRGGSALLEHFEDLANAGKMDGPTLKSAIGSEINYVQDKAMDPTGANYRQPASAASGGGKPSGNASRAAGFTRIQSSDGMLHDIPSDKLDAAKKIDPKLQVIQ